MHKIIVYTNPSCPWCEEAKKFFNEKKIKFTEKNVEIDKYAKEALKKSGQMTVPIIEIDGKIIVGFEKSKINSLLN